MAAEAHNKVQQNDATAKNLNEVRAGLLEITVTTLQLQELL
jgi:hypothetical protein